jgi:glycosyltransferase involved in cell wall biosynthesis
MVMRLPISFPSTKRPQRSGLTAGLDRPLPDPLCAGLDTDLVITGWCHHSECSIASVEFELDGRRFPAEFHGFRRYGRKGVGAWGAFGGIVSVPSCQWPRSVELQVRAVLSTGRVKTAVLGRVNLRSGRVADPPPPEVYSRSLPADPIVVCMATYNSPPELFARQIRSLRAQTLRDWVCVICDDHSRQDRFANLLSVVGHDPRFRIHRQPTNRGFYRNFEQCLALVPPTARFVALADQDDEWRPDKLAALHSRFGPRTTLVYSDMRLIDPDGTVLSPTFWATRRNNYSNFASLLLANTVTGAASMFRRELLDVMLPFPPGFGDAFHDHWLSCVALACGEMRFVDRPLYDYVQHSGNVVGHYGPKPLPSHARLGQWLTFFRPSKLAMNCRAFLVTGRATYFAHTLRIRQWARTLAARCAGRMTAEKRVVLRRVATMHASPAGWLWLLLRPFRHLDGVSDTVSIEFHLLNALMWERYQAFKSRLFSGWGRRTEDVDGDEIRKAA